MTESGRIVHEVAASVGLAEGEAFATSFRAARLEPVAVRKISRVTELPIPIVSAICNELRKRGVVDRARPVQPDGARPRAVRLTGRRDRGRSSLPNLRAAGDRRPGIPRAGRQRLAAFADRAPTARVELDQVHCDVETKIRRVLALHEAGALDGRRILLLGDDDLTSLAISSSPSSRRAPGSDRRGRGRPGIVAFLRRAPSTCMSSCMTSATRFPSTSVARSTPCSPIPRTRSRGHALPLPRGRSSCRGVAGRCLLRVRRKAAGRSCRSAARSRRWVRHSQARAELQRVPRRRALGGVSHLYQLASTSEVRPLLAARYDGRLYTGDLRPPVRRYRCRSCRRVDEVGHRQAWSTIEALRGDGCPCCGRRTVPSARPIRVGSRRAGPHVPSMEAELVSELPEGDGWQYEPKWDGFRGVLENDGGELASGRARSVRSFVTSRSCSATCCRPTPRSTARS